MNKEQREKFEKQIAQEKRIAELEQENAELTTDNNTLLKENGILRKENAELRKESEVVSCNTFCRDNHFRLQDQFTKAKELLERLLITSCNSDVLNLLPNCSEVLKVRVEAEQFISEVKDDKI